MTIEKRLARSNIAMLAIPLVTAAVLAGLAACGALVLLGYAGDVRRTRDGPGGLRIVFTLPIAKEDAYA